MLHRGRRTVVLQTDTPMMGKIQERFDRFHEGVTIPPCVVVFTVCGVVECRDRHHGLPVRERDRVPFHGAPPSHSSSGSPQIGHSVELYHS